MKLNILCSLSAIALLAACGGGGGGGDDGMDPPDPIIPSFANAQALIDEGEDALARVEALELTEQDDLQRTGSAQFDGTIVINDATATADSGSVLGGITVNVTFADEDTVTGTAGNFFDLADTEVGGTLELDNVAFSEGSEGGGFVTDITGRLTNVGRTGADDSYDYDVDGVFLYYGDGVDASIALLSGTTSKVGQAVDRDVTGAATLERQ